MLTEPETACPVKQDLRTTCSGVDVYVWQIMTKTTRSTAFYIAAFCLLSVCAQDQLVKVSLDKRPLSLDQLPSPHRRAGQLGLLQSANGGEDIPILNFLDAQVRVSPVFGACLAKLLGNIVLMMKCSIMVKSAWEALLRTFW